MLGLSDRVEQSPNIVEQDCMPTQGKVKSISRKIAKISSQTPTSLSPPAVVRQSRPSSQQLIVPNNHFATPQLLVTSSGIQNSRHSSDDASETGLTTEMNFIAVNSNSEELDHMEQPNNAATDGLGTLGKVWSMNQVF